MSRSGGASQELDARRFRFPAVLLHPPLTVIGLDTRAWNNESWRGISPYDDMPGERSAEAAVIAGGAKAAWFKDSEGNILAIIQTL